MSTKHCQAFAKHCQLGLPMSTKHCQALPSIAKYPRLGCYSMVLGWRLSWSPVDAAWESTTPPSEIWPLRVASRQLFVCAEASFGVRYAWPIRPPCGARVLPRGVPEPCRGGAPEGVCHSPAGGGGVYQRWVPEGCRCWEPPHALGGLLCGRRGAPEGCAKALPRGCAKGCRRGAAVGNRRMPWEASYVGGGVRRRGVP